MNDIEEGSVCLGDMAKLWWLRKRTVCRIALTGALVGLALGFVLPSSYEARASFKEANDPTNVSSSMNSLSALLSMSRGKSSSLSGIAKSRMLLRRTVEDAALQVIPARAGDGEAVLFTHCSYSGTQRGSFALRSLREGELCIKDDRGAIHRAKLGEELSLPNMRFCVARCAPANQWRRFTLIPMNTTIDRLQKRIVITSNVSDPSIIHLSLRDTNPRVASATLDALMDNYKRYLTQESSRVTREHLATLYEHKNAVQKQLFEDFERHVQTMRSNIEQVGFLDHDSELRFLYAKQSALLQQDVECDEAIRNLKSSKYAVVEHNAEARDYYQKRCRLKEQKDQLDLDFFQSKPLSEVIAHIPKSCEPASAPVRSTASGAIDQRLNTLASMHRQCAEHNALFTYNRLRDFGGLDYASAHKLYTDELKKVQALKQTKQQLNLGLEALRGGVEDPVALQSLVHSLQQPMLDAFYATLINLEKGEYYSEKDKERMRKEVNARKGYLVKSLTEQKAVAEDAIASASAFLERIKATMLALVNRELLVTDRHIEELRQQALEKVQREKSHVTARLTSVRETLRMVPEKWLFARKLELESSVNTKIMENLVQFIESKNVSQKLSSIEASPLDAGYCDGRQKNLSPVAMAGAGAGLGAAFSFLTLLLIQLARGLPLSRAALQQRGFSVAGAVDGSICSGALSEASLETLRKGLSVCMQDGGIFTLATGRGPNFCSAIATLLGYRASSVVVVDIDAWQMRSKAPHSGLWHYLQGKLSTLPIQHKEGYDLLEMGGNDRFALEMIETPSFATLLSTLQTAYTYVLLHTSAPLESAEVRACAYKSRGVLFGFREEVRESMGSILRWIRSAHINHAFIEY